MRTKELKVEYRQLGKSGLRVSVPILGALSFGTSRWGQAPWVLNAEDAFPILKEAWDLGINTIDTANSYSNGESERVIGKFIKKYNIPRHQIIIATKCYRLVAEYPELRTSTTPGLQNRREYVNQSGLSRAAIFNAVNASLERLGTDYIDLLHIHRFDPDVPPEETMKALHDLVESGKVRYIGGSSMRCWQFAMLNEVAARNGWTKFVSMQDEYSLLYREEEREMHAYCNHHGIGIIPWGPLATGDLARPLGVETERASASKGTIFERKFSPSDELIVMRVEELARKYDKPMSQIALAWINGRVASPIIGVSSIQRLHEGIITGFQLTPEEERYLEEPYEPKRIRGHA
ncbi:Aldo keto reductase [Coniophora puteana RWD-64-598 SS2]|uniref:Aldo keto reductase n=1 Tax=Coniophora puteana (strain RWD-64-598) TaxID=741705 RepID=R7SF41_CONPW|nr:Aldo keto reductase [Coniophora puteana RWD-64-598 SS2]EIW74500.1 Aldo keto reductase [Coniophora puteana RWD-64-598 SS2]